MHVDFSIIDLDYSIRRKAMVLYGKTVDDQKICVVDPTFLMSFWVVPSDSEKVRAFIDRMEQIRIPAEGGSVYYVARTEIQERKILGRPVSAIRVFVSDVTGIKALKDELKSLDDCLLYEDDFPLSRRYLLDKGLTPLMVCTVEGEEIVDDFPVDLVIRATALHQKGETLIKHPKILAFDIEVANALRFPDDSKDPVVMISFYGTDGFAKVLTWKSFSNPKKYIEVCSSEADMLVRFKQVIQDFKPDYIVGYFSDGFDFPYLRKRASVHKIKLNVGLNGSEIKLVKRKDAMTAKILGIAHIDIYKFIRRVMGNTLDIEDFDLDTVGRALLGEGKTDVDVSQLYDAWTKEDDRLRDFCEYNLTDSKLAYRLTQIMLPSLHELVKLVRQPLYDIARMTYGQLAEWYLIHEVQHVKELVPARPRVREVLARRMQTYEGAFVYEPVAGFYHNIVVFDFRSLYPSIITAHNICPSTLTSSSENSHQTPDIEVKGKSVHYYFDYKKDGFIPTILKDVIQRRIRIKEILKSGEGKPDPVLNARQDTLKILANSFYGYLGFPAARWYSRECAASIAAYGRYYIRAVIRKAEEKGFTVLYSDTDSIFIALQEKPVKEALTFLRDINHELPSLIELEYEGFYPRGIFVMKKGSERGAKKKYALIDEKGKMKITGFETIRGDWSTIAKEVQHRVFEIILKEEKPDAAFTYVKDIIQQIQKHEIPLEKMIIQKQLQKQLEDYESIGPHVAVAHALKKEGAPIGPGSIIEYVIAEGKGVLRDRATTPKQCKTYDAPYYIENQIIPAVQRIFEVLGLDTTLLLKREQSKLGDF